MRRREFITLLGGAAAWPFAALAQQSDRMRRIGFLTGAADDTNSRAMYEAFQQGLQQLRPSRANAQAYDDRARERLRVLSMHLTGLA